MNPKPNTSLQTDWLGSEPVFYNERTGAVGHSVHDVIDYAHIELHPEGFNNYLAFGYSVFGQTPLRDVKYLPHSSRLTRTADNALSVERLPDIAETHLTTTTSEGEALERFAHSVATWERSFTKEIVLPLSGGFDSRLLNHFITDKERVRAFTYGTSEVPAWSFEVINARAIAQALGERWERINLTDFFGRIDDWEALYGPATHAHGMYQLEFFSQVKNRVGTGAQVLSGIIGDAWAGSVKIPPITTPDELTPLGYSHGMHADVDASLMKSGGDLRHEYFGTHTERLHDPRWRVLESMRFKMVLLSYLLAVPRSLGFPTWSPFIVPEVALGMLTIDPARRVNRQWQRDFFSKYPALNVERRLIKDRKNTLNLQALRTQKPLPPLHVSLLGQYVKPDYIEWINSTLARAPRTLAHKRLLATPASLFYLFPGIHSLPSRFGLDPYTLKNEESRALSAYLVLHPIQSILKMRR
jgi:hypothetical protein